MLIIDKIKEYISATKSTNLHLSSNIKDEVYLPSPGLFAEAILGRSNASEYINPKRFYNWQDSPIPHLAPQIQALNLNQDFTSDTLVNTRPTVPDSVLQQQNPTQYAIPVNSAMQAVQNGNMFRDMNQVSQLTSVMGSLAQLANQTAQLASSMAGDAAQNALNGAIELGKQVAGMVNNAMNQTSAPPPLTQTEKGAALNILEEIENKSKGSGELSQPINPNTNTTPNQPSVRQTTPIRPMPKTYDTSKASAEVMGTNIKSEQSNIDYNFIFQFINFDGAPLTGGSFFCELQFGTNTVALNGGNYIDLDYTGKFNKEHFNLPINTKCFITIQEESTRFMGTSSFILKEEQLIIVKVKINVEEMEIEETQESVNSDEKWKKVANNLNVGGGISTEESKLKLINKFIKFLKYININVEASYEHVDENGNNNTTEIGNSRITKFKIYIPIQPLIISIE